MAAMQDIASAIPSNERQFASGHDSSDALIGRSSGGTCSCYADHASYDGSVLNFRRWDSQRSDDLSDDSSTCASTRTSPSPVPPDGEDVSCHISTSDVAFATSSADAATDCHHPECCSGDLDKRADKQSRPSPFLMEALRRVSSARRPSLSSVSEAAPGEASGGGGAAGASSSNGTAGAAAAVPEPRVAPISVLAPKPPTSSAPANPRRRPNRSHTESAMAVGLDVAASTSSAPATALSRPPWRQKAPPAVCEQQQPSGGGVRSSSAADFLDPAIERAHFLRAVRLMRDQLTSADAALENEESPSCLRSALPPRPRSAAARLSMTPFHSQ